MSQVNVNPGGGDDGAGAAAAGLSAGLVLMLIVGLIVLLVVAYMVLRPLFAGGTSNVNVTIRSSDLLDTLRLIA